MKTPTLEEVKKRFENAELVQCLMDNSVHCVDLKKIREHHEDYWCTDDDTNFMIFGYGKFAKIISYRDDSEPTTQFSDSNEGRLKYIDVGLRLANIQLNQELLVKVVKVVDLVNEKGGKVSVEDIVKL
jgi:hypothetical protein